MIVTPHVRLIVNADDFGMTAGTNRAVAELSSARALTSTTLMACGEAFDDAVRTAQRQTSLGVGCHVVLVDGSATGRHSASLVSNDGTFASSMAHFAAAVMARYTKAEHIENETAAQIAKLQNSGIHVTHVDTHKHTHLLPVVARAVMRGARLRGVRAIRNPFEPSWCSALSPAPASRRVPFRLLHRFRAAFQCLLAEEGMQSTDASLGLIATGSLNAEVVRRILLAAPPGTYELVCHPGYNDQDLDCIKTKLRESREIEREALLDVIPNLPKKRFELISFAGLTGSLPGPFPKTA